MFNRGFAEFSIEPILTVIKSAIISTQLFYTCTIDVKYVPGDFVTFAHVMAHGHAFRIV